MIHVGVDLHQRFCYLTAVEARGKIVQAGPVANEKAALRKYFRQFRGQGVEVAVEACGFWPAFREVVETGALMSYGVNLVDLFHDVAAFVDQVARGVNAGDVPMGAPSHFHTAFNLKTAKALGLDIPPMLLARADEVIE